MKQKYILKNLACAGCAAKIEAQVQKISEVKDASLSFATSTLSVTTTNDYSGDLDKDIEKIVKSLEPDVDVIKKKSSHNHSHNHSHGDGDSKIILVRIAISATLFILAILFKDFYSLRATMFVLAYIIVGYDVVFNAIRNIFKGHFLDENFLMAIASLGAMAIKEFPEGVAVMLFYQVGEYFQGRAVNHSRKSIASLMDIRPDYANILIDNNLTRVSPEDVKIGDTIVVKPGEKIPLDGVVIDGTSMIDTSALTGESVPRTAKSGDDVLSGCINQSGVLTIEVQKEFAQSTVSKILDLVENASSKKAPTENFITTFAKYYTPTVVFLALALAIIPPLAFNGVWNDWIYRALLFLVVSCPCALVISIPLGFFGGIGGASKNGVLVKGGNFLEALSKTDTIVFDKTGTLTQGVFKVNKIIGENSFSEQEILRYAACAESFSNHPIAQSIKDEYKNDLSNEKIEDYEEISGHGIFVKINGLDVLVGNAKLLYRYNIKFKEYDDVGTKVYVSVDSVFAGCIIISDKIKDDSVKAIKQLKDLGIRKTVMLTGDAKQVAHSVAKELELDEVFAELLPDQKVERLEELLKDVPNGRKLIFVGDGINDAPVLARADVGIAMGGVGSDAAIEAADVVLMTDEPSKLSSALRISRFTKRVVTQNIVFALTCKFIVLVLGALGLATMWEAVFVDVGVSLIAVINSMRATNAK
ncbi:MAG: heavy metal translocating P-type ATPase [Acutalibacteraceae bacterium]|jgi:Cd2+/Zn2+-exporting ATPase